MLGWRKRNDGFEWREYVRTTILVRRKQRRDRIGEAGKAAIDNLKAAGQRGAAAGAESAMALGRGAVHVGQQGAKVGAEGAKAFGRGAVNVGQQGAKLSAEGARLGAHGAMAFGRGAAQYGQRAALLGAAGARQAASKARDATPVVGDWLQRFGAGLIAAAAYVWAVVRTVAGIAADYIGPPLQPVGRYLRAPGVRNILLAVGLVALAGGIIRANANGFERDTVIALAIGGVALGALALAHLALGLPDRMTSSFAAFSTNLRRPIAGAGQRPWVQGSLGALVLALLAVGSIWAWFGSNPAPATKNARQTRHETTSTGALPAADLSGRATAISGDTLRVGSRQLRLAGIEAPELYQSCTGADGRAWACGDSARQGLARLLRAGNVSCDVSAGDGDDAVGSCRLGERDVAAELVRDGFAFGETGIFAPYRGEEEAARSARRGIWAGEATRPADYRARRWEEAQRNSPDGCPIKGSVRGGRRYYVVPWARDYDRVRVPRGGRWFCSEAEAQEAGFKPSGNS